jgi:hypothetical protein
MIGAADGKLMNAKRLQASSYVEEIPRITLKTSSLYIDIKTV